jgi:hypothetical protein
MNVKNDNMEAKYTKADIDKKDIVGKKPLKKEGAR